MQNCVAKHCSIKIAAFKCDHVKSYFFGITEDTFEKVIWHLNIWQLFDSYTKQSERNIKNSIWHESWLGKVVAEWDGVRELNAFEKRYLDWILLLQDETLVQETKYLALHFCCFSMIMLCRNLEYLCILWSANRYFELGVVIFVLTIHEHKTQTLKNTVWSLFKDGVQLSQG